MSTDLLDLSSVPDPSLFDPVSYDAGLSDGVMDFSGSSGLPDVTAGSDSLTLWTGPGTTPTSSINDLTSDPFGNLSLSGISDPFFGPSATASTPYPNQAQPTNNLNAMLSSLGKFGSGLASLFGAQQQTVSNKAATVMSTGTKAASSPLAVNGSQTTILLIVIAAAVLLLMREGE
jgi:hypothetical protein